MNMHGICFLGLMLMTEAVSCCCAEELCELPVLQKASGATVFEAQKNLRVISPERVTKDFIMGLVNKQMFEVWLNLTLELGQKDLFAATLAVSIHESLSEPFEILLAHPKLQDNSFRYDHLLLHTVESGHTELVRMVIDAFGDRMGRHAVIAAYDICCCDLGKREISELLEARFQDVIAQYVADRLKQNIGCVIS